MTRDAARLRAIGWALAGAFFYTLIFSSAKFIGSQSNPVQIVFMNYLVSAVIISAIAVVILRRTGGFAIQMPRTHVARAFASVFGDLCIISAPLFIAYEDATAISLTDGVITMLLAVLLLKERAMPSHWLAATICLAGAILVAHADTHAHGLNSAWIGLALAGLGALFSGSEMLFIKILSDRDRPVVIMLTVNVLGALLLLGPALWVWKPIESGDFLWLLLIGPLALAEEYCWIKALQNAAAVAVVPIGYASIPFAAVLGIFAFGQSLGPQEIVGATLVLAGGILLSRLSEQEAQEPR